MDILGALAGLALGSPIFLLVAVLIKLESPGPVFAEGQIRIGKGGKVFRMFKFRSMVQNAHEVLRTDPKMSKWYEEYKENNFKLSTDKDPRITRTGRFIRKTSLDELPQLLNILRGEMSLVGPRAFHIDEVEEQAKKFPEGREYLKKSLEIKPGLTGLWQVSGRSRVDFPERVKLDAYYAEKKNLWTDLVILLKTPGTIFKGEGT